MLQAKWFQEFQPIGGVNPKPLSRHKLKVNKIANNSKEIFFIFIF